MLGSIGCAGGKLEANVIVNSDQPELRLGLKLLYQAYDQKKWHFSFVVLN